jgi:hypothetical protein
MPLHVQLVGSFVALAAFVATQVRWITVTSVLYLALNAVGSAALVTSAVVEAQWGFVILESVWGAVSALSLCRELAHRRS